MNFPNHAQKATQAVARLIEKTGGPVEYLRLSKLVYLADRQSILERGVPIVGGQYFSMRKGPVISEVMNFVNRRNAPQWKDTISPRHGNDIKLQGKPSYSSLSQSELNILDAVVLEHSERPTNDLVGWCHDNCPEYQKVLGSGRKPIEVESILDGAKRSKDQIKKVIQCAEEIEEMDALLA